MVPFFTVSGVQFVPFYFECLEQPESRMHCHLDLKHEGYPPKMCACSQEYMSQFSKWDVIPADFQILLLPTNYCIHLWFARCVENDSIPRYVCIFVSILADEWVAGSTMCRIWELEPPTFERHLRRGLHPPITAFSVLSKYANEITTVKIDR